jgi:hypothetical protein
LLLVLRETRPKRSRATTRTSVRAAYEEIERLLGDATARKGRWGDLHDSGFERLLFDLLRALPGHENVQWLMNTRAADRGRDLSLDHYPVEVVE